MSKNIIVVVFVSVLCLGVMLGFALSPKVKQARLLPSLRIPDQLTSSGFGQLAGIPSDFVPQPLILEEIFTSDKNWIATLSAERLRTIIVPGDLIPARSVNTQAVSRNSFTWVFEKTADLLKSGDVTFINLETALLSQCPIHDSGFTFCGDKRHIEGLSMSGVDVVSLANNHAGNFGLEGVQETEGLLRDAGMSVTGTGTIVYKDIRGERFAFLGFNDIGTGPGIVNALEETMREQIREAKQKGSVVVVMFHWGTEYQAQPDARQRYLAYFVIDNGADLVVSNHPHWVQPVEIYKGKLIAYAHGNFVFDQMWSEETRRGVVGRYVFYDNEFISVEYTPIKIFDYGQPHIMTGTDEGSLILEQMKYESQRLQETL